MVQSGRSSVPLIMPPRSNNFCVGGCLPVDDSKGLFDRLFDAHADLDAFGRPMGNRPVDLSVVDLAFLLLIFTFCHHPFFYRERQYSVQCHHHHFGVNILLNGGGRIAAKAFYLYGSLVRLSKSNPAICLEFKVYFKITKIYISKRRRLD